MVYHFDKEVEASFGALSEKHGFQLKRLCKGVYEIEAKEFSMRIREGTGHKTDILVTIVPTSLRSNNPKYLDNEKGLGNLAKFNNEELSSFWGKPSLDADGEAAYSRAVNRVAVDAERLVIPYLLGLKNDYPLFERFVQGL